MLNPFILDTMSTGSFVAFIMASGVLIKPIRQLTEVNSDIQKGIAASESILLLLLIVMLRWIRADTKLSP